MAVPSRVKQIENNRELTGSSPVMIANRSPTNAKTAVLGIGKPPDEQQSMRATNPRIRERSTVV
jgi:hypothetical protein